MEVPDLHLAEIKFNSAPTKSQIENTLLDISKFLGNCGAAMILDGSYTIADQCLGVMLNTGITLKQTADLFQQGPNASGLAVPQPGPQVVRGR